MKRVLLRWMMAMLTAICTLAGVAAQDSVASDVVKVATDLSRAKLASELGIDIASIEVLSSEAQTWPNSSLGCGKAGGSSLQVVTPGHEVLLKTPRGIYRVHATQKSAVVCGLATQWRNPRNVGAPLRNLNEKIGIARTDLGKKIGAREGSIRTLNSVAMEWPDNSMGCSIDGETLVKRVTKGYRIAFNYQGRIYTYHTDLDRVRACPAIEVE